MCWQFRLSFQEGIGGEDQGKWHWFRQRLGAIQRIDSGWGLFTFSYHKLLITLLVLSIWLKDEQLPKDAADDGSRKWIIWIGIDVQLSHIHSPITFLFVFPMLILILCTHSLQTIFSQSWSWYRSPRWIWFVIDTYFDKHFAALTRWPLHSVNAANTALKIAQKKGVKSLTPMLCSEVSIDDLKLLNHCHSQYSLMTSKSWLLWFVWWQYSNPLEFRLSSLSTTSDSRFNHFLFRTYWKRRLERGLLPMSQHSF